MHRGLLGHGISALPQRRHCLELRVKVDAGSAVEGVGTASGNRLLVAGEGEHGQRHGDGHVDAHLTGLDVLAERLGSGARLCEDGNAVAVLVLVDELNGVVDSLDIEAHQHGAEDLLLVAGHVGSDVGDDGGSDEVAVGVLFRLEATAVEQDCSTLLLGAVNDAQDALLALGGDDGAQIGALLEATVDLERLSVLSNLREPLLGLANHDQCAQGHATLTGSAKGRSHDTVDEVVLVAVGEDGGVVLGSQIGLDTLAVGRGASVDVLAGLVATDEAHGLDGGLVKDEVDGVVGAVDDADNAGREAGLFSQLDEDHGGTGITF